MKQGTAALSGERGITGETADEDWADGIVARASRLFAQATPDLASSEAAPDYFAGTSLQPGIEPVLEMLETLQRDKRKLYEGCSGPEVQLLKSALNIMAGLELLNAADDKYDAATERAVKYYQHRRKLEDDGVLGNGTAGQLAKDLRSGCCFTGDWDRLAALLVTYPEGDTIGKNVFEGVRVQALRIALNRIFDGNLEARSERWDIDLKSAVTRYQETNHLNNDGWAGPKTIWRMAEDLGVEEATGGTMRRFVVGPFDTINDLAERELGFWYLSHLFFEHNKERLAASGPETLQIGERLLLPKGCAEYFCSIFSQLYNREAPGWKLPAAENLTVTYRELLCPVMGVEPKKTNALFKTPIDKSDGELHGDSRLPGDAAPEVQAEIIHRILSLCHQHRLTIREAAVVLTIIQFESGFNPDAVNPGSSAAGLAQAIEKTRERYCSRKGVSSANPFCWEVAEACIVTGLIEDGRRAALCRGAELGSVDHLLWGYQWHYNETFKDGEQGDGYKLAKDKLIEPFQRNLKILEGLTAN